MFKLFNNKKTRIYVDFENIKIKGLEGIEELTRDDMLFLFHSMNADTITISLAEKIKSSKAKIEMIKCTTGVNAMDFVISTLIGNHIANDNNKIKYFIVSNDKGYQAIIDYWKDKTIKRILNLKQVHNETEIEEKESVKANVNKKKNTQSNNKNQILEKQQKQKKKREINIRSRIGMLIPGIKKRDMNEIEKIIKDESKDYLKLLTEKFGEKGNEYYKKLQPLFSVVKKK